MSRDITVKMEIKEGNHPKLETHDEGTTATSEEVTQSFGELTNISPPSNPDSVPCYRQVKLEDCSGSHGSVKIEALAVGNGAGDEEKQLEEGTAQKRKESCESCDVNVQMAKEITQVLYEQGQDEGYQTPLETHHEVNAPESNDVKLCYEVQNPNLPHFTPQFILIPFYLGVQFEQSSGSDSFVATEEPPLSKSSVETAVSEEQVEKDSSVLEQQESPHEKDKLPSDDKREQMLAYMREYEKRQRLNETPDEREKRLAKKRNYHKKKMMNLSLEEKEKYRTYWRNESRKRRENETPEQREKRLAYDREYYKKKALTKTPEEKERKNANTRIRRKNQMLNETPEQREERLASKRNYYKQCTNLDQKEKRRAYLRDYYKKKVMQETPDQRETRLAQARERKKRNLEKTIANIEKHGLMKKMHK